MTLQGETLVWVMYSPVTHLPSDVRVTVIFYMSGSLGLALGRQHYCLERSIRAISSGWIVIMIIINQVHHHHHLHCRFSLTLHCAR